MWQIIKNLEPWTLNQGGWLRTSSCHSEKPIVQPWGFRTRWRIPHELTLLAARESIAIISGSVSGTATAPEGGNCADASSPEKSDSPSDAAIDIRSSRGAPKDTDGAHLWDGPPRSSGSSAGCGVQEEWGFLGGWYPEGNALTVILRSPVSPLAATLWGGVERGSGTGTPPLCRSWSLDRNSEMVIFPHWVHDSSTNAASACAKPRHAMQRSWPSLGAR